MTIDTAFSFTEDTEGFWNNFWDNNYGLGAGSRDPDSESQTLKSYHRFLWSKPLPCGDIMQLELGGEANYLTWRDFRFGSDSLIVSFRYQRNADLLKKVASSVPDYHAFVKRYLLKSYTIGGMTIFPKHKNSINQAKGCNKYICDRLDLTLECIRRYYAKEQSPLSGILEMDANFFKLFVDFRGFIDFFFFQDLVLEDYSEVKFWIDNGGLDTLYPVPKTVEQYLKFIDDELTFVEKRNARIAEWARGFTC